MDLKKDQSHGILYQTTDTDTEKTYEPFVIGPWHLRNREQLKRRKLEAQKKQMLEWHLEDQKTHKRGRSRNVSRKGLNKQQRSETIAKPLLQVEKETQVAPAQNESQNSETEAPPHSTSSSKDLPEEYSFGIHRESFRRGENSARYHDKAVMNCFSETDQQTGPGDSLLNTCQKSPGSEKFSFEQEPKTYRLEDFFITLEAIPIPQPHGPDDPAYLLREICEEPTVPRASYKAIGVTPKPEVNSLETCQEICRDEKRSPEAFQEVPGIEDVSNKRHQNSDEAFDYFLDEIQETDASEDQDTDIHLKVNTQTFRK